jgi:hypothetical protein
MSSREQWNEDVLLAATLIAWNINEPSFDGFITYDDQGNQILGSDVEVFVLGQRNSFDIILRSNGKLYATDNGPNTKYGVPSTGCYEQSDSHLTQADKLNLIVQGGYYGHANRKRGATDNVNGEALTNQVTAILGSRLQSYHRHRMVYASFRRSILVASSVES